MSFQRSERTLRPFRLIPEFEERAIKMGVARAKGHCRMILDILRTKPAGYSWTAREVWKELEKNPRFRSSTATFRAANWWIWKLRRVGVIEWTDQR